MAGWAQVLSVLSYCCACFALRQPASWASMYASAALVDLKGQLAEAVGFELTEELPLRQFSSSRQKSIKTMS